MRDLVLARIAELRKIPSVSYLFADAKGKATGYSTPVYRHDEDFSTYMDENLIAAFERISRQSGKQFG